MRKYIDADKAIEVCDWYEHEYSECEDYIRTIAEDIRHLPAADVAEVRHGKWEKMAETDLWECSVCGYMIYSETVLDRKTFYKWCGRCGAKMDEVTE